MEDLLNRKSQPFNFLGHAFMVLLLVILVSLYLKTNIFWKEDQFTYLYALALPFAALQLVGGLFLFQRYVSKLQQSHPRVFANLLTLLCLIEITLAGFVVIFSIYLQNPPENKGIFEISLVPYYLSLLIWVGVLVYLSPGLLDQVNGIPQY